MSQSRQERLEQLRQGLETRGLQSSWGKLRVVELDAEALDVTLEAETPNYLFEHRFKTARPRVALSELSEKRYFTPALEERRLLEELRPLWEAGPPSDGS